MRSYININFFKFNQEFRIFFLWLKWLLKHYRKIKQVKKTLKFLNQSSPSFSQRFPQINTKSFLRQCKYWNHWVKKMDPREKLFFKEWTPIILINEEYWLYLDFSKKEIPVLNYSFYSPNEEWIEIKVFNSLMEFHRFFDVFGGNDKQFASLIKELTLSKGITLSTDKKGKNVEDLYDFEVDSYKSVKKIESFLKAPKFFLRT